MSEESKPFEHSCTFCGGTRIYKDTIDLTKNGKVVAHDRTALVCKDCDLVIDVLED